VNVQTTVSEGYDRRSGTGLACSVTAGVAALGLAAHPEWGPTELRGRLKQTAVDLGLPENEQGAGRVDAATLLSGDGGTDGNKAPIAKMLFSHPEPDVGQTVFLDGGASVDSDGDIVEYRWEHGGTEETGTIVETTVSEPGRYEVTLTVTDDDGATDSTTRALLVGDGDGTSPIARMEISDRHPAVGDTVTVDGSESTDPNGEIVEYRWEHGGTEETGETISLTPSEEGSYEVTLTVTDDDGATDTTSQTIDVGSNQAPTADMVISHLEPDLGETVYFNGKASIDADGEIVEYRWEHGGHEETGEIMETSVSEKGPYEVTLTVTDDDGATDSTTREIQVGGSEGNTPPTAKFRTNTTEPDVGEVVFFDAGNSRDPDGDIVEYRWEDGDGDSLTGQVVQAAGPRNRAYQVTLTVTDDDGATDSTTKIIYVGGKDDDNEAPTAAFTVSPSDPSGGETVTLDAGDSTDPDGDVVLYTWTDNLGNTEHGDVAELSAPEDGPWEITLEIMDDAGATDVVSKDVLGSSSRAIAYAGPKHVQTVENRLNGYLDSERFTYTTTLSDPAQVTVSLDGPDDADFDLFVTTDGRTPKTYDFDRQSVTQDSHETIVLEDVDPGQELGILVDVWSGMGLYTATVEELE
jgi:PKD repeat protein